MKYIYVLTCKHGIPTYAWPKKDWPKDEKEHSRLNSSRTFGWFSSLKRAKEAIELDGEWYHEEEFMLAVIEKVSEGAMCGDIPKEWWYEWTGGHENGKYVPIDKPEVLKQTIAWGMG